MVYGSNIIKRIFSVAIIFLMILPNFIVPVSAATEAKKIFSYNFDGVKINSVDTNDAGTLTFAGLDNGSIICMDNGGTIIYNVFPSGLGDRSVKKVQSDQTGNLVYVTVNGDTGYINTTGSVLYVWISSVGVYNMSDIDIDYYNANNVGLWWRIHNTTSLSRMYGLTPAGTYPYENLSYGTAIWTNIEYDPVNKLVVITNATSNGFPSEKIYLWNVSNFTGWLDFNPTKTTKNTTQLLLDSFPRRQALSFNNGDTTPVSLRFLDSPTATNVTLNSNGTFTFNASRHGKYFLWTYTSNISINQQMLNLSTWNATAKQLIVSTKPAGTLGDNLTFYFGNPTYTNEILTSVYNITANITVTSNASGWTAPSNAHMVFRINVTGGGAGGEGGLFDSAPSKSRGGKASIPTSGSYGFINPSSYFAFTIGAGGDGGPGDGAAPGGGDGGSGGTTTAFGLTSAGASGSSHATGEPGENNTAMPGGYAVAGQNSGDAIPGGIGGIGYGAGGGAGGTSASESYSGNGGKGAGGAVNFTYLTWTPQYFNGSAMTSPGLKIEELEDISTSLNYVSNIALTGNATAISIPPSGGIVGVSTAGATAGVTGKVYHIEISQTGFGAQYSGTSDTGITQQISTSSGGAVSIEARGSNIDIYDLAGAQVGTYTTGGPTYSVDLADKNGLWATGGGSDGILYIFDKATTSGWEVYYQGDSAAAILSVAMTGGGEYVAVGRSDGTFEYYYVKSPIATTEQVFSVDVFVTKGGTPYSNVNVTITEMTNAIPALYTGLNVTSKTDTNGKVVFTATEQRYYNISVNDGEYYQMYQASPSYKVVSINIPYALLTRPFQYNAVYSDASHTITSTYDDVNNANINISIIDIQSKQMVYSADYLGVRSFTNNYVVPDANKTYKVVFNFTRTTGAVYSDTIYTQPALYNSIPKNTSDQYTLFIYAIYTLVLMVIALSIGTQSLKYGTVLLVALTFLGITLGFLPMSLYTVGIATSAFIAMLEVYRRRE